MDAKYAGPSIRGVGIVFFSRLSVGGAESGAGCEPPSDDFAGLFVVETVDD